MTAEIIAMNPLAVAMAADSAVTIGGKVFNSANKIFALSRRHPIGIMIYGHSDFIGVPLETIIKMYRKEDGGEELKTVEEYYDRFLNFIEKGFNKFDKDFVNSFNLFLMDDYAKSAFGKIISNSETPRKSKIRLRSMVGNEIDRLFKEFDKFDYISGFDEARNDRILVSLKDDIDTIIKTTFEDAISSNRRASKLRHILSWVLTKKWTNSGLTGIVVAGFGKDEHFPVVIASECRSLVDGTVTVVSKQTQSVTVTNRACLMPLAQGDVTATFVEGVNPEFQQAILEFMEKAFSDFKRMLTTQADKDRADQLLSTFKSEFKTYKTDRHVKPIIDMLTVLPKDELARLATSLVEMTSLKRHVSNDVESVGGPIDVAVISKGDGLIWISRKHYFTPEANPDYFLRQKLGWGATNG